MRCFITILIAFATLISCGGTRKKSSSVQAMEPIFYTYEVVAQYPHSRTSYTQGLQFVDGQLWEGTGEYGNSRILRTELATGKILESKAISKEEFGEGITILGDKIYQLTWLNGKLHIYDRKTLKHLATHSYKGEGWGLTSDGTKLYMSDGTHTIRVINPENGVVEGVINLSGILPESEYDRKTDVLNGIAYDKATNRIFVTGKNWSKLFEIKLIAQ